jgi:hypothetical protein
MDELAKIVFPLLKPEFSLLQQSKSRILQVIHRFGGENKLKKLLSKTARCSKFVLATIECKLSSPVAQWSVHLPIGVCTTPKVVGSNPTSGEEFAGGAWFIPHTVTGIDVIATCNVIATFKQRIWLYSNPPKP